VESGIRELREAIVGGVAGNALGIQARLELDRERFSDHERRISKIERRYQET
jgi:hypothetical protein